MTAEEDPFKTYAEFWLYYLSQHTKRASRLLHIGGTLLALIAIIWAVVSFNFIWLLAAPVIGYGAAWIGHAFIEHNHPATFTYPLWSLRGDLRMLWLWLSGRLEAELVQRGITT